jgi:hypothetical protein
VIIGICRRKMKRHIMIERDLIRTLVPSFTSSYLAYKKMRPEMAKRKARKAKKTPFSTP